jgi:tetratricopeptide (TPR) repeat protein
VPEAEATYQEAMATYRQLTETNALGYLPEMALTLTNLAVFYSSIHHLPEAVATYQEALTLRRQLAQAHPTAYLPSVATTLNDLAVLALAQNHVPQAEVWVEEAVMIRRGLWHQEPTIHRDALAQSLGIEALVRQRAGAKPAMVCKNLQEAARLAYDTSLQHFAHERIRAWCGGGKQ